MTDEKRPLQVFLCHAHEDQVTVRALYKRLVKDGIDAWLDKEKLLGGANWEYEIRKAVRESDVVVVCLSRQFSEGGFRKKEVRIALDEAALKPKEEIFIIPVRLEECDVLEQLTNWHWVDLFRRGGYYKLMESLKSRGLQLQRATVELPKPDETNPNLAEELKPEQTKNIFSTVDGNALGNIIIDNENAVQSQKIRPKPEEKQVEPKTPVVAEEKEPEKPVLPSFVDKKEQGKSPRKLKTEYIVAIIGAAATIIAGILSSPWIEKRFAPALVPTATATATMPATQSPTATFTALPPSETPKPSPTPREVFMLTFTPLPTQITDFAGVKMRFVPAEKFTMGSNADAARIECQRHSKYSNYCKNSWFVDEEPPHQVYLPNYYMDVYEVTNALYKVCVDAAVCQKPADTNHYDNSTYFANHPVVYVNWSQAKTYCEWRGARLPTEAEWEKAARGIDGRTYPWGEGVDDTFANNRVGLTTTVGSYEKGKSPYGLYDMAGNVWEWTADWYDVYPGGNPQAVSTFGQKYRVVRGGPEKENIIAARVSNRKQANPDSTNSITGFRCILPIP